MKNKLLVYFVMLFMVLVAASLGFQGHAEAATVYELNGNTASPWTVTLLAVGENAGGANQSSVKIGIAPEAKMYDAPPSPPPTYSVYMVLYSTTDWRTLTEDVRQEGDLQYTWIIGINPAGNIPPPGRPRTAMLNWDAKGFGAGIYQLREGYDETGPIVVADMKTTTSYDVVGRQGFQFFTVVGVVPIPGTIWLLGSGLIGILGVRRRFKK